MVLYYHILIDEYLTITYIYYMYYNMIYYNYITEYMIYNISK